MSTVLVVDDRAINRETARAAIDLGGHQVIEASDGAEAIALTGRLHPDVVVVDVLMPRMDGYEFVHQLRSTPDTADIPVLFYTANFSADELAPMALSHRVSRVVLKSAEPSELLEAVNEAIRARPNSVLPPARIAFDEHHSLTMNAKLIEKARALDESDARFTTMSEVAPVGIVIGDLSGSATYVNPLLCEITRMRAVDLLGLGWLSCLGPDGQRDVQARLAAGAQQGRSTAPVDTLRSHAYVTLPNDESRWLTVRVRPMYDSERTGTGFIAMIDDVSAVVAAQDRRLLEDREREAESRRQVTERFDSLARLAGGTAHDFNNLLNIILNHDEFATESLTEAAGRLLTDTETATIQHDLAQIRGAGLRAGRLAHQLLALGGREVVKPSVVDVDALVAEMHDELAEALGGHVKIGTDRDAGPHHVLADQGQLSQVLMNLAVNAGEAMPDGGRLHIMITHVAHPERTPQMTLAPGDYVHIAVTDDGHGMPSEVVRHALEPFFTTKSAGGLGLATSYGVVKQAGGALVIRSAPGHGTTVHVYLPATDRDVDRPAGPAPAVTATGQTILVAEDEDGVRDLVARILDKAGYHVLTGADGEQALAVAENHPGVVHAVLTDVVMPNMNGRQLAEAVERKWPGTPILYMSGYAAPIMTEQGLVAADVTVLGKPFSRTDLLAAVRITLAGQVAR
jgi:PAS domain S-box-containing protein